VSTPDTGAGSPLVRTDGLDTEVAHPARRYNYWLGGKDHFAADRESGDRIAKHQPQILTDVRANRDFINRAVRHLATHESVAQFLDVGTGIPAEPSVHRIAQTVDPGARVVYVDNDLLVMTHARALLTGTAQGVTAYAQADLRHPDTVLGHAEVRKTLDFTQPIVLVLGAVLHFIDDDEQAYSIVTHLVRALPAGSFLVISHFTDDYLPEATRQTIGRLAGPDRPDGTFRPRSRAQLTRFVTGLTVIDPGICPVTDWRPDPTPSRDVIANVYAAVARVDHSWTDA
jgi:hypothetical protein